MSHGSAGGRVVSSPLIDRYTGVSININAVVVNSVNQAGSTDPTVDPLTRVLFGEDFDREHAPWRRLAAAAPFRRRPGASSGERLAMAYERLRTVNDTLDSPAELVADPRGLAALHEWLGPVDPAFTTVAGIHYNLFLGSLLDHAEGEKGVARGTARDAAGSADAADAAELADFFALRRVGTFLCTEVAHGNDAVAVETTAAYDRERDGFVLCTPHAGAQKFMPNTSPVGGPKSGVVAARLLVDGADQGVFLFLTPLTDAVGALPGVRVRRLPARLGSPVDHCLTSFDRVFVGRDALLGGAQGRIGEDGVFRSEQSNRRRRFLTSIGRVTAGKLSMSACAVGSARVTLALAVRYGGHRRISGSRGGERVPVFAHRSHHGPLVGALAMVFGMTLLHRTALDAWESRTEVGTAEAERLVAVAKGWISWRAREVIVESRERCGAQALLENNGMTELLAGIEGVITAEGDNVAIYAKAAAEMLFSAALAPGPGPGPEQGQGQGQGPGREPVAVSGPEPGDGSYGPSRRELTDPLFLDGLLVAVESVWLARARRRMSQVPHGDSLARWNAASGAALRAVEAYAYRRASEAYAVAVAGLAPGSSPSSPSSGSDTSTTSAHDLLRSLHRLFALQWIDRNSGDLLAGGRLAPRHLDELPEAVEQLISRLAGHAPALVESFALPEEMFADWPISGAGYVDAYDDAEGAWHAVLAVPVAPA
ncbi:acyl-CoA oxidase [Streptomyces scopuliridis]|uniref:acyl-CoA dehydrogenase family protein n=1 Tax=Streptomyces scopuliridis TaxID=452529 RepID=UPI002DD84E47|nr:acyl-CoA dehydrogenase [Streptomyces scopuliridis]WSB34922.1 acyl-CoA oxidase [Streptomyces scopuliridis]